MSLISELQNPNSTPQQQTTIIIEAEVVNFSEDEEKILAPILLDFIQKHYGTKQENISTSVCSAIRKYVAIISVDELSTISDLLNPDYEIPIMVELEILKMLYRKFEANPPNKNSAFPDISCFVYNIANEYISAHRVLKNAKYYSAATLNAVLCLVAMRDFYIDDAWVFSDESPKWLNEHVKSRIKKLAQIWEQRYNNIEASDYVNYIHSVWPDKK